MAYRRRSPTHKVSSSSSSSPSVVRKKYSLRRATTRTSSHASIQSPISPSTPLDHRPVLVPLHPNLRRLPSRLFVNKDADKDMVMRDPDQVILVGNKRKRVASTNENALANGRPTKGPSRRKRLRTTSMTKPYVEYLSEETDMEVDTVSSQSSTTAESREESEPEVESDSEVEKSEVKDEEEEEEDESSTDDHHLLHFASSKKLARLRKPDLVRLYILANLPDDAGLLTKHEIIDCLISAREDIASLPPSSPIGRNDCSSSGSLSDDGNVAGDEETDVTPIDLPGTMRRRVTVQDFGTVNGRPLKGRSMSMGNLINREGSIIDHGHSRKESVEVKAELNGSSASRRRASARSSPTSSNPTSASEPQSPPATRLRTRKVSTTVSIPSTTPTSANSRNGRSKSKSKQVEFNPQVDIRLNSPSKRRLRERAQEREREREARAKRLAEESDLTDADEVERSLNSNQNGVAPPLLSPRRLRSKDKESEKGRAWPPEDEEETPRPVRQRGPARQPVNLGQAASPTRGGHKRLTRLRLGKRKILGPKEGHLLNGEEVDELEEQYDDASLSEDKGEAGDEGEEDEEGEGEEEMEDEDEDDNEDEEDEGGEVDEDGEEDEEECEEEQENEIDELISSASATPPRSKGRQTPLKKRLRPRDRTGSATPDDGDVEDEGDEDSDEGQAIEEVEGPEEAQEVGVEDEGVEEDVEGISEDETTIAVEPRKLRSGKVVGDDDVEMETAEEDIGEEDSETGEEEEGEGGSGVDMDAEGETDEDEIMEEVDLAVATTKTLVRLRRDDLVRLCETRDLEPVGTKPQLVEALLQWRDRHCHDQSSPSSSGTVRPPSTTRRGKRKRVTSSTITTTPVLLRPEHIHEDEPRTPVPDHDKEADQDLELDLESLGLEDREIPPEKLAKLEKIGSGGFKDVFIGKFKGRRVAISEFRDTLSAMDIKELKLLGGFDHPNIVRFLGVSIPENTKETPVMIVSELCSNGDLFDYIRNTNTPSLHKVLSMMLDIARGLEYLHMRKPSVIHRDCKSSNILITARGTAKIADFGLAKVKQSTRSMVKSLVGTVNWQAPELWTAHPKYNHKVDVFSCALVFWEMLQWHLPVRKHPWEGMNEHAIYEIVGSKRQRPSISGLRKQWCPEIIELVERMWAQEHQDRPTMTEIVQELEGMLANRK